jgi:hypothetical protein
VNDELDYLSSLKLRKHPRFSVDHASHATAVKAPWRFGNSDRKRFYLSSLK